MRMQCYEIMSVLFVPHQKKKKLLSIIDVVRVVGGNSHSSPWLVLTKQSYAVMGSVPIEEHNIYNIHHNLSPKWHPHI
jgi:hypothetical protein